MRFVYAQPTAWHLRVTPGRDVIERTLPADLDLAGWDMRKTLDLLLRGNCTIREWLCSPLRYREVPALVAGLRDLAERVPARPAALHHYVSLATKVEVAWLGRAPVNYKKYFYAIRPALVLRWLRMHPAGTPPMDLPALLAGTGLPPDVAAALDDLLARKAAASEVGGGEPIPLLGRFIVAELEWARGAMLREPAVHPDEETLHAADALLARAAAFADAASRPMPRPLPKS